MFDFSYSNILHSNLINFLIMLVLFISIFAFLNVPKSIKNATDRVKDDIEKSNDEKEKSKLNLKEAQDKFEKSDIEAQKIIDDANKTSNDFMIKAQNDAQSMIEGIKEDFERIYEREIFKIKKDVTLDVSKKSLQKSTEKLKKMFENPELQEKYLYSAIKKLEEIDL